MGFKAEYDVSQEELVKSAGLRLKEADADLMVANDVAVEGAGFGSTRTKWCWLMTKCWIFLKAPKKK